MANKKAKDTKKGKNYSLKSIINNDKKKNVYKPILDNPFTETQRSLWPEITAKDEEQLEQQIIPHLRKLLNNENEILSHLIKSGKITLGFNSTNKKLEYQAQKIYGNWKDNKSTAMRKKTADLVRYVFICKEDIHPSILYSHIPALCCTASFNFYDPGDERQVTLIPLPKNTKQTLMINNRENSKDATFLPIISLSSDLSDEFEYALKNCEAVKPLSISKYRKLSNEYAKANAKLLHRKCD